MKAINGYGTGYDTRFSSYAYARIDGELRHHFRDTALVKRPRSARSLYAKISESTTRLTGELGRPPLVEEIAGDVNVAPEGVVEVMKLFSDTNVARRLLQRLGWRRGARPLGDQDPPVRDVLFADRGQYPA